MLNYQCLNIKRQVSIFSHQYNHLKILSNIIIIINYQLSILRTINTINTTTINNSQLSKRYQYFNHTYVINTISN